MRRRVLPITAVFALAATAALTGCTAVGSADECAPLVAPGALSDSVRISGSSIDTLNVSLLQGTRLINSERSLTVEAEDRDRVAVEGAVVAANLAYVDGLTGEVLDGAPGFLQSRGSQVFLVGVGDSFSASLACTAPGDVVSIALTAQESQGFNYQGGELLLIAEITGVSGVQAEGKSQTLPFGFPAVTTDQTGRPGVVMPPQDAPAEERVALRIEGSGEKVAAADNVIGQVLTVSWDGVQKKNSWEEMLLAFGSEDQPQTDLRAALTGFPVGSQVIIIEPATQERGAQVSVIDILAVA